MTILNYKHLFLLFAILSTRITFACSCSVPTIEEEYKQSELVIEGRLIGIDTIVAAKSISKDRHGIRYGKHKYTINFQTLVRAKFLVQTNYKSSTLLADTVYILTSVEPTACGYYFPPFYSQLSSYYDFIIFGDRWIDYSIEETINRKRHGKQIKRKPLQNTFFTSSCKLTQLANETELSKLEKLKT